MPPNKRKRKKRQLDHNREADRKKRLQVENVAKRILGIQNKIKWDVWEPSGGEYGTKG
jgi:hypothetical protein